MLAVKYARERRSFSSTIAETSSNSPGTSPLFLCLLSTSAAVICLFGRQRFFTSVTGGQGSTLKKVNSETSGSSHAGDGKSPCRCGGSPSATSLVVLEKWTVQCRAVWGGALFVTMVVPFLQLFPGSTKDKQPFYYNPKVEVFSWSFLFFSVIQILSRIIVQTTNG